MARKAKEVMAPTRDIVSRAKDWTIIVLAGSSTIAFLTAVFTYSRPVLDSGPMPFPSRMEVDSVRTDLATRDKADDNLHQAQLDQTKQLADQLQHIADEQRRTAQERLTNQIRNLQSSLDVAKAIYDKDPSLANKGVLDALEAQMNDLQKQLMATTPK